MSKNEIVLDQDDDIIPVNLELKLATNKYNSPKVNTIASYIEKTIIDNENEIVEFIVPLLYIDIDEEYNLTNEMRDEINVAIDNRFSKSELNVDLLDDITPKDVRSTDPYGKNITKKHKIGTIYISKDCSLVISDINDKDIYDIVN